MKRTLSSVSIIALGLGLAAGAAQAQTVLTTGNGIVRSSLCVGFDCQTGISFSDSTIIVKENNTRIKFADTSVSASFPTNDWEIEANSNANGGQSYLGFNDCGSTSVNGGCTSDLVFAVEGGAPANTLRLESDGDAGFGTANPVVDLHAVDGNTPTLRLEQDGSSGFAAQTWDVAGNEAGFFIRDATSGSTLPFRILGGGAPSQSLLIDGDGNIGMGAGTSPDGKLHTSGSGVQLIYFESSNDDAVQVRMRTDSGNRRFLATDGADNVETQIVFDNNEVRIAGATDSGANLWATIDANGITTQGPDCATPCDAVFDREAFTVPSIEEHAAYMWENMHLKAVGPTGPEHAFNLTAKTAGMLHELEIAHIYIAEQNEVIKSMGADIETLTARLVQLEAQLPE